ncbi:choline transporter-like protein 2 [Sabethes cyaneus]|uniref:choline transporter-like protein 2 n=1 Tax=Sabethes cyaneus TaxID=53552 RepID=UPI00237DAD65|nr:choline transporter-like protein 2 [Sabethes cyaneus]
MPRRNSTTSPDDVEAAVYRKHRKCTDVAALVIMALYMIGLFSLVFLCLAKSDPFRIINGYDDCGNVCGRSNNPINGLACSGQNMLAYKYLLLERVPNSTETTKSCVEKCPTNYGYKLNYNRCVRFQQERPVSDQVTQNVFDEIWQDVYNCGVELFCYFLVDGQHMVTAGAISSWYFTRKKSGLGNAEGRSFLKLLKYHLGSVALGSLMFSVTLPIRFIIKSFELILNQISNGLAAYCSNFSIGCRIYYGWCLELIQRIAYVVVALQGLPFFKAGKSAVMIMMASATNFVVVHSVANIIFLLLKLFIVGLVGSIGVEILQKKCDLYHPYFLAGIFGVAVVTITHCFISVYEMTNTTVLLCFCKDIRENNGTDRPYYMSRNLRKFLPNEHNETYRARTIR